jgi:small-conductance mechanosensitive channel
VEDLLERLRIDVPASVSGALDALLVVGLIAVIAYVALRFASLAVSLLVSRLLDREALEGTAQELSAIEIEKRRTTLVGLSDRLLRFFVVAIALLMALGELGFDIGPAVAGLGVVGIAVGFGAQSLVRDYLAGAYILIENHYAKGDTVTIAAVTGIVEDFTLRRTTLRAEDGTVHVVPNGLIGVTSNLTRVWARITLNITVGPGTNLDRAASVVDAVGRGMAEHEGWRRRLLETPRVERLEALTVDGPTLRIGCTVRAAERWAAAGELRRRVFDGLRAAGIEVRAG